MKGYYTLDTGNLSIAELFALRNYCIEMQQSKTSKHLSLSKNKMQLRYKEIQTECEEHLSDIIFEFQPTN